MYVNDRLKFINANNMWPYVAIDTSFYTQVITRIMLYFVLKLYFFF
jgi:hypothetical protein